MIMNMETTCMFNKFQGIIIKIIQHTNNHLQKPESLQTIQKQQTKCSNKYKLPKSIKLNKNNSIILLPLEKIHL